MKILQISSAKTFGGGERHFVDLCRGLQKRGHEVFAVLRPTSEWKERLDFLPPQNIRYISIRNSFGIFSAQRIARFIRANNIEIVHAHVAKDYFPASLACRIAKTPKFILTRHVLFPMKGFHRFALTNLSKAIAVSRAVEKQLQTLFLHNKIQVISNGIEVRDLPAAERISLREAFRFEHDISFDAFLIGTVGELKELKGQRDFVLAANLVAEKFPEAHFVVVGKANAANRGFRRELKRMVMVFGLIERFLWLNWVEDTTGLLNSLDVFVSPSHSESFGLAILEAMINQTPIVSTETEGAKELLQNGRSGLIVPVQDPVRLAEAIGKLLADEKLRRELGKNSAQTATEKFDLEKMIAETERLYRSLL
jgi:glycosyltransferase involved in cell wall biosynthesis